MPRGKKNLVVNAHPSTENVIISSGSSSDKVKIDTLLWNFRELCRKHNLQMFNKESLANQIYQDLLFIYHIPKLMKDGILTLDIERIGDSKLSEISYTSLLSLKEPELISSSFKRLWKELQKCEIKDLFYGREFTMFAIEKKNPQRYLALLVDLFKYISSITLEEYDSNAGYTYFKKDLNKAIAKTFGQFYTPNTVTSSVVKQVDPKVGEKVLDPSCGSCSFLAETANYISKKCNVDMKTAFKNLYGIEVESNIYAEGVMNMFINFGILPDMTNNIREKDALIDLVSNSDEFDKVVANPPFGANASAAGKETHSYGYVLIDNPTSSTKSKSFQFNYIYFDNTAAASKSFQGSGAFYSTTAITTVDIVRLSGSDTFTNQNDTTIRLLGIS
jgi:hypothetical protein